MGRKSATDEMRNATESTEATLIALSAQISAFVLEGTLDSRCAVKLVKRLKKEAEALSENGTATKPGQKELKKAFDAVVAAARDHDATLLVAANAALRATDNGDKAAKSQ
jgi:hypothetical protein